MASNDDDKPYKDDELIDVKLSRQKYEVLRRMLELDPDLMEQEQERMVVLNVLSRWFRNFAFIFAGGIVSIIVFWEKTKQYFMG